MACTCECRNRQGIKFLGVTCEICKTESRLRKVVPWTIQSFAQMEIANILRKLSASCDNELLKPIMARVAMQSEMAAHAAMALSGESTRFCDRSKLVMKVAECRGLCFH